VLEVAKLPCDPCCSVGGGCDRKHREQAAARICCDHRPATRNGTWQPKGAIEL